MRKILMLFALTLTLVMAKAQDPVFQYAIVSSADAAQADIELSQLVSITFDQTKMYLRDANDGVIASVNLCDFDKLSFSQWPTGLQDITKDPDPEVYTQGDGIYTIKGLKVASSVEELEGLPTDIYIIKQGNKIQKLLHK